MKEKFGIEIEFISQHGRDTINSNLRILLGSSNVNNGLKSWIVKHDGSVRGDASYPFAYEITSPPMKINQMGELKKVLTYLNECCKVNSTCGLHIHVECNEIESVQNTMIIWRKFESQIIKIFPRSRHKNKYCMKLSGKKLTTLLNMNFSRYHMVNPTSYWRHGTVEFRGHAGSINYHKIKRWVLFVTAMVRKAQSYQGNRNSLLETIKIRNLDLFDFISMKNTKTEKYMEGRARHFYNERERKAA